MNMKLHILRKAKTGDIDPFNDPFIIKPNCFGKKKNYILPF